MTLDLIRNSIALCGADITNDFFGEDILLLSSFENLRLEVDKSTSLHSEQETDWTIVFTTAIELWSERSKDIWLLCFMIRAAYPLAGLEGSLVCLQHTNSLLSKYWDNLYPSLKRKQRRCAPFLWLIAQLEPLFRSDSLITQPNAIRHEFLAELATLQTLLTDKLDDLSPSLSSLKRLVPLSEDEEENDDETSISADINTSETIPSALNTEKSSATKTPPESDSQPDKEQTAQNKDSDDSPQQIQKSASKLKDKKSKKSTHKKTLPPELDPQLLAQGRIPPTVLPQILRTTQENMQQLAVHYLTSDMMDWRAYLLHRAALWGTVSQLPQCDASGVTQLRAIPQNKTILYQSGIQNKYYKETLPSLEHSAGKAPFWFDGHYMVAQCLDAMKAQGAYQIICLTLTQFISHFPELTDMRFHDNSPFASAQTKQWLEEIQQKYDSSASDINWFLAQPILTENDVPDALLEVALDMFDEHGFTAGLTHLGTVPAGRNRAAIVHALLKAKYCFATGNTDIALPLLQTIYQQLQDWSMLDWEPELTASIIALLYATASQKKEALPLAELQYLHWLHLETAITITQK